MSVSVNFAAPQIGASSSLIRNNYATPGSHGADIALTDGGVCRMVHSLTVLAQEAEVLFVVHGIPKFP